jgi:prepilin-type N-terminal cleavage/methylation domain-containing protein
MKTTNPPSLSVRKTNAFTLVEVLVVIAIVALLATLAFPAIQNIRKSSAQSKSVAAMRAVLQSAVLYTSENNGQIPTMRFEGENTILRNPPGRWVANAFWGRVQPYLFPEIPPTNNQHKLAEDITINLQKLFGTPDLRTMTGTPFAGARIYVDTSTIPVPFSFNTNLKLWNQWVTNQQIYSLPRTIYMAYGFGVFDETDGQTYHPLPKPGEPPGSRIYFLPSKQAIAGFLDGRVEFLSPPIPRKMIRIDGMD